MKALQINCNRFEQKNKFETSDSKEQINFIGSLDEDNASMLFIINKSEETTFEFHKIL